MNRRAIMDRIGAAFHEASGFPLAGHMVVLGIMGSHSHGTYVPPSDPKAIDDIDFMGIVVPPVERVLGLRKFEHWVWQRDELDVTIYSLEKAVTLLLKGNPNILGLLWLESDDYFGMGMPHGPNLLAGREHFSSKLAYHSFVGYAHGQLKRMTAFNEDKMREYEHLTTTLREWGVDLLELLAADGQKIAHMAREAAASLGREAVDVQATLQSFRSLHKNYFSGYMGEKRKQLVREVGYDAKNASHLIRLLRMGAEFFETGQMQVRRPDADELLAIKRGQWGLDAVRDEADRLFARAKVAKDASPLPENPDREWAERFLIDATLLSFGAKFRGEG